MKSTSTIWMKSIPIDESVGWGGVGWGRDNGKGERVHGLCVRERARL
jgi:hypothetical protein